VPSELRLRSRFHPTSCLHQIVEMATNRNVKKSRSQSAKTKKTLKGKTRGSLLRSLRRLFLTSAGPDRAHRHLLRHDIRGSAARRLIDELKTSREIRALALPQAEPKGSA
jgi:hypothetical protein